ncbi:hypothetical protein HDU98_010267 [Podochytrium sp. JEL0797]|nr:hypothetical protein HDU98_010249 [Podochytrium sp. JEL0797]KAJ3076991.1 hypothetical protein HDU98_010267 [Podochytrium sp. JEL0797]
MASALKAHHAALFTPIRVGDMQLTHRIAMAPLTRSRSPNYTANTHNALYYSQRATPGGLIISEGTTVSQLCPITFYNVCSPHGHQSLQVHPTANGYPDVPRIDTLVHAEAWKASTDAIHRKGGYIYAQLWHVGRMSQPKFQPDNKPHVSSSATSAHKDRAPARALTIPEIKDIVRSYAESARLAVEVAGFDGVEIHAAHGYLIEQFLNDNTNLRTDDYGGSIENRTRFLFEVVDAVLKVVPVSKVAIRISPDVNMQGMKDSDPKTLYTNVLSRLNEYDLSYIQLTEPLWGMYLQGPPHNESKLVYYRSLITNPLTKVILTGGYTGESAQEAVESGRADLVGLGRAFISNPDLVQRIRYALPITPYVADQSGKYGGGVKMYSDYKTWEEEQAATSADFAMLTSRQLKNWFKAVVAYVLATAFAYSPWGSRIQTRALYFVIFTNTVNAPSKTVGNYIMVTFILLITFLYSSAVWAFIQAVAGGSYVGMAAVLFLNTYMLSLVRWAKPNLMIVALLGTILAFDSITSVLELSGPNTSGGNRFDHVYLKNILTACCLGLAIGLVVNLCIFPDRAEQHLSERFSLLLHHISNLSRLSNACLITTDFSHESHDANRASRIALARDIQRAFAAIDTTISEASMEITYSHLSVRDYSAIARQCKSVAAVLFSLNAVLNSKECEALVGRQEYRESMSVEVLVTWRELEAACDAKKKRGEEEEVKSVALVQLEKAVEKALSAFEGHRLELFSGIFRDDGIDHGGPGVHSNASWEMFVQLNFHLLATKEFAKELTNLYDLVRTSARHEQGVRFHFNFYSPKKTGAESSKKPIHKSKPKKTVKSVLIGTSTFLLSPCSVYALKVATAVLCLQLIMYSNPEFYKTWNVSYAITPVIVAVSPSLGQTLKDAPRRILGVTLGTTLAYLTVLWFGRSSLFHILMGCLAALPGFFLAVYNPALFPVALLSLTNFGKFTMVALANADNPFFEAPAVYLYKAVAVTSTAILFTTVFTLLIYPRSAALALRHRMSDIFVSLCSFYLQILQGAKSDTIDRVKVKNMGTKILSQLVTLDPLVMFACSEPRLNAFPAEDYRQVITCMYRLLNRFEGMRLCVGDAPFDREIRQMTKKGEYGASRRELHKTIRVLLYLFKSILLTGTPVLPNLPNASYARERMISRLVSNLVRHQRGDGSELMETVLPRDIDGMLETLSTRKWVGLLTLNVSSREVSRVLDGIGERMKLIFGEAADIVDEDSEEEVDEVEVVTRI